MDFRIGAKSPIYSTQYTSKVTDRALKASFARMMAETKASAAGTKAAGTKAVQQDTMEISGDALEKRLERVHQKIDELDFAGKDVFEEYRSVLEIYEEEFGFSDLLCYIDTDAHDVVYKDKEAALESIIPDYQIMKHILHRAAMGYDQMSKEETIAAIKERVGGNTYVHKICEINELQRAHVITAAQGSVMYHNLMINAEKEYCAEMGYDYLDWSARPEKYGDNPYVGGKAKLNSNFIAWTTKADTTWLDIIDGIVKNGTMLEWKAKAFMKESEEVFELLKRSDNT